MGKKNKRRRSRGSHERFLERKKRQQRRREANGVGIREVNLEELVQSIQENSARRNERARQRSVALMQLEAQASALPSAEHLRRTEEALREFSRGMGVSVRAVCDSMAQVGRAFVNAQRSFSETLVEKREEPAPDLVDKLAPRTFEVD